MAGPSADTTLGRLDQPRVLLIDPDRHTRSAVVAALTEAGCEVVAALRTGMAAEYAVRQHRPTVIVLDLDLRGGGPLAGLLLVASLAEEAPRTPLLVIARSDGLAEEMAGRALRAGARQVLTRPGDGEVAAAVLIEHDAVFQAAYPTGGGRRAHPSSG
jgi:DNA-binding NarL/FixJ family response regulator